MIRILVTGGTFDKEYNELTGSLFFRHTHLHEMLRLRTLSRRRVRRNADDDRQSRHDRRRSRRASSKSARRPRKTQIVITHGTDTMVETAKALAAAFPSGGTKTIVLTGAMIPYAFGSSDGLFNLGSAISFVQVLPAGVYVAMNGRYFPWDRVTKNRETGVFESV